MKLLTASLLNDCAGLIMTEKEDANAELTALIERIISKTTEICLQTDDPIQRASVRLGMAFAIGFERWKADDALHVRKDVMPFCLLDQVHKFMEIALAVYSPNPIHRQKLLAEFMKNFAEQSFEKGLLVKPKFKKPARQQRNSPIMDANGRPIRKH